MHLFTDFSEHSPFASWDELFLPGAILASCVGTAWIFRLVRRHLSDIPVELAARATFACNAVAFLGSVSAGMLYVPSFNLTLSIAALGIGSWLSSAIIRAEKQVFPYYNRFF